MRGPNRDGSYAARLSIGIQLVHGLLTKRHCTKPVLLQDEAKNRHDNETRASRIGWKRHGQDREFTEALRTRYLD